MFVRNMDSKVAAALLVLLLVGSSLAVFTLSSNDEDAGESEKIEITDTGDQNNQPQITNAEPLILVEHYYSEWTGTNHSLEGYIVDEGRTTVEVTMLNMDFSVPVSYTHLTLPTSG